MTKDSPEQQKKEADRRLAQRAWSLAWSRKTPIWAGLGVAVVFLFRAFVCDYEDTSAEDLDFKWYGEHCGPGHGDPNREPVDELDEECRRHDEVYQRASEAKKSP